MSNLVTANFGNLNIRTLEEGSKSLFHLNDTLSALKVTRQDVKDNDIKILKRTVDTGFGPEQMSFIEEGDAYSLAFESDTDEAKAFQKYVSSLMSNLIKHGTLPIKAPISSNGTVSASSMLGLDSPDVGVRQAPEMAAKVREMLEGILGPNIFKDLLKK